MANEPICPCDGAPDERKIDNAPAQSRIGYRVGDFRSFRHALLSTPPAPFDNEQQLKDWQPSATDDLGTQMLEWWAYLADILTFYNERIANESYLRTATQPENLRRLIRTLGYRPKPGVAAHGTLAALVGGHRPVTLPKGFSVDSKPGPGEQSQTFELDADTTVNPAGTVPADPPAFAFKPDSWRFLIAGTKPPFKAGAHLKLESRNGAFTPLLLTIKTIATETAADGTVHSSVTFDASASVPATATAADLLLLQATQSMPSNSIDASAVSADAIHLAGIVRDIRAGDVVLVITADAVELRSVASTYEHLWYANHGAAGPDAAPAGDVGPVAVLHTVLSFKSPSAYEGELLGSLHDHTAGIEAALSGNAVPEPMSGSHSDMLIGAEAGFQAPPAEAKMAMIEIEASVDSSAAATVTATVGYGWRPAGQLLDQPVTAYSSGPLAARAPAAFPQGDTQAILIGDAADAGMAGNGLTSDGKSLTVSNLAPAATLKTPLTVHYNLLDVSRGKSVASEVLGSGNAGIPGQSFVLKKSPLTYLAKGDGVASTLRVWVGGREWTEAASFYEQEGDAEIFVTREDDDQKTHVMFGDGVNGARLPTNANNVVASYRHGSGAKSPSAGTLTVIGKPYPNLKSLKNPVAVGGGGDPDPADKIRRLAPRSAMTFGRAISGDDYQVIAAQAPGVTRAQAVWSFDADEQRSAVKIYVGDDNAAVASARDAIAATADPHRHVVIAPATPITIGLKLHLVIDPRYLASDLIAAATAALLDDDNGLFGARRLGVGEAVFNSQIDAACLGCEGVVAVNDIVFATHRWIHNEERHAPGEGAFFRLAPQNLRITAGVA